MSQHLRRVAKQPSVQRLPAYLRLIKELRDQGEEAVSTTYLAELLDLQPIIVRKDLSVTGIVGRPRIGYDVPELIAAIETYLGWDQVREAILVGVGHLGTALLGYSGLADYRLRVLAAFDSDSGKTGRDVHGCPVHPWETAPSFVSAHGVQMAILTVPAAVAQPVADALVAAGIRAIWNFSPMKLHLPPHVVSHQEDLTAGLGVLSLKLRLLLATEE
jgi:redox-sensing transcriptional repressor